MPVIKEGIILNENKSLSRTHKDVTRLSKNGNLLLETVPGATIHEFNISENKVEFFAEGIGDTLITIELEPNVVYSLYINDVNIDKIKTNLSGKINFSTSLSKDKQTIKIEKI